MWTTLSEPTGARVQSEVGENDFRRIAGDHQIRRLAASCRDAQHRVRHFKLIPAYPVVVVAGIDEDALHVLEGSRAARATMTTGGLRLSLRASYVELSLLLMKRKLG